MRLAEAWTDPSPHHPPPALPPNFREIPVCLYVCDRWLWIQQCRTVIILDHHGKRAISGHTATYVLSILDTILQLPHTQRIRLSFPVNLIENWMEKKQTINRNAKKVTPNHKWCSWRMKQQLKLCVSKNKTPESKKKDRCRKLRED